MKKVTLICMLALGAFTFQSCGSKKASDDSVENADNANEKKEDNGTGQKEDDSEFAVKAASGGMLEVEAGRMAQEKSQNQQIKAFGAKLVTDHTKANDELKALAATKNVTLPTTPGEDAQKHIDELRKLTGTDFDKKFISMMVDDHEDDVNLFKKAADDAKDPGIKAFAAKTLPTLEEHLTMVKELDKTVNK